jgi:mRNA-degrading endonuclease RelE of RelBE toxin-antitoxin system
MPPKAHFVWTAAARADLRKIELETARRILLALTRYGQTGQGDIKALEGKLAGTFRLRIGDWRVRFRRRADRTIEVLGVKNRGEAY